MEYILLTAYSEQELSQKVNKYLDEGWQLRGDVVIHFGYFLDTFYQVLTFDDFFDVDDDLHIGSWTPPENAIKLKNEQSGILQNNYSPNNFFNMVTGLILPNAYISGSIINIESGLQAYPYDDFR